MSDIQPTETILIVDDEDPVRRTFREWLVGAGLDCEILTAHDAESALQLANEKTIDLAILDWALGAGDDGLQLLQDLYVFNPDVIAIMVTGFANQATPLDAMRMGVRDYLDKNQDLNRETFLHAVRKQLDYIRPARRQRLLHLELVAFRESVEKILPLVQSAAALKGPVPLPDAVVRLFRFLLRTTGAAEGVLLVRHFDARSGTESCDAYKPDGKRLEEPLVPFARSMAAGVIGMQEASIMVNPQAAAEAGAFELQPFERDRRSLLAAPMIVDQATTAVLELFDKESGATFTPEDRKLAGAAAEFGADMFRQALASRQTHQMLIDAVQAALGASESLTSKMTGKAAERLQQPPPDAVLEQLREELDATSPGRGDVEETLQLAEAIRVLALRHGKPALRHCIRLIENVRDLLDEVTEGSW